jgi:hypothetical protein
MSVTKALPLVKNRPARAGRKAKAKGELCQCDRSSGAVESSWSRPKDGRMKSPAECRVSSKLEKESSEERRREKDGSIEGEAPSAAVGNVFVDERLRRFKEGGRGSADDDAPATGVCEASSGEGGADVLKDGLVIVPVVEDWREGVKVHDMVCKRLAIVTALQVAATLRVPSSSQLLVAVLASIHPFGSHLQARRDDHLRCGDHLPPCFLPWPGSLLSYYNVVRKSRFFLQRQLFSVSSNANSELRGGLACWPPRNSLPCTYP